MSQVLPERQQEAAGAVTTEAPPAATGEPGVAKIQGRSPLQLAFQRFKRDKMAIASFFFIVLLAIVAFGSPVIASILKHPPNSTKYVYDMTNEFGYPKGPNLHFKFFFGADQFGRDLFVRTLYGARVSLIIGLLATGLSIMIGTVVGLFAGFYRGIVDTILSRINDVLLSVPILLLSLGLIAIFRPSLKIIIFVIAFVNWTYISRIIRGQVLSLREKEFIEASRSLGASNVRIIFKDLLPNLVAPILVYSTLIIPTNIVLESSLSFLGLGINPPTATWGQMLADAESFYQVAWWMLVFPGAGLLLTTIAFNLLGDGLRDALDPRGSLSA